MPSGKYDVISVGSGMGGLGTAALLAKQGYKVLVVEKRPFVGGRFSSYEYEGFILPTGAVTVHYKGTETEEVFRDSGVALDLVDVSGLYYRIEGKDYQMPAKGALGVGLDIISKLESDKAKVLGGFAKAMSKETIMGAFHVGSKDPAKERGLTFKDWLLQYTDSELALAIFDTILGTLAAAHTYEIQASAVFQFFTAMKGFREVAIPGHGNRGNMENLAKVVTDNGGDVWVDTEVKRILVERGAVKGIVVEKDGKEVEIDAQVVVSNVGPKATVGLADSGNFNEDYLKDVRMRLKPKSVTMAFVASDVPLWPENGSPQILMVVGARRMTSAIPLSSISPALAPPGQHLMFVFGSPLTCEAKMDEEVEKNTILQDLKEQFPLFEKHGRVIKYDCRDIDDDLPEMRTRVGLGMPCETPIKNLYNVGCGCPAPGYTGSNGAAENAVRVSKIIKKQVKPGK